MLDTIGGAINLLLVIIGFGGVIFIHELGHFLAAKWMGVRVRQFAIGFGSAAISYRKGLGFRFGSSEKELDTLIEDEPLGLADRDPATVSPTEYRLNWIPFGGYVKMLGQEDIDPAATSAEPDSYSQKPVWRRMIIISAGVVMNIILAAVLFVVVYMVGRTMPTPRIGAIAPDSPASRAALVSGDPAGTPPTLQPGDRVTRIAGAHPKSFNDITLEVVMASPTHPIEIDVARAGAAEPLVFRATPIKSPTTGMLMVGLAPAATNRLVAPDTPDSADQALIREVFDSVGFTGVEPGMTLVSVNGADPDGPWDLIDALEQSDGAPVRAEFRGDGARPVIVAVDPMPIFQTSTAPIPGTDDTVPAQHILGLTPAVRVATVTPRAAQAGLVVGDLIVRVGSVDWPNIAQVIGAIRAHRGSRIDVAVWRDGRRVDLSPSVNRKGQIGFGPTEALRESAVVTRPPVEQAEGDAAGPIVFAADRLGLIPGSVIERVGERTISNFIDLRAALRAATAQARSANTGAEVSLTVRLPIEPAGETPILEHHVWALTADEIQTLHALGWRSPVSLALFELEQARVQTSSPMRAVAWGVQDTRRMMVKTYLTFLRLAQGTVRVDQLKGPVGIAHLGAQVAERGLTDLLFFLGLISVNLAVINFLPIPIADGGLFVMLLIEKMTGRPVSPAVQGAATMVGLVLIVGVFLLVTFNDITALFGG